MSSRLMPPKVGSRIWQVRMISSGSLVSSSISKTSISAKRLKSTALPSITGFPAKAPILPRPSNVFQVDAAESRLQVHAGADDLPRVLGVELDIHVFDIELD